MNRPAVPSTRPPRGAPGPPRDAFRSRPFDLALGGPFDPRLVAVRIAERQATNPGARRERLAQARHFPELERLVRGVEVLHLESERRLVLRRGALAAPVQAERDALRLELHPPVGLGAD